LSRREGDTVAVTATVFHLPIGHVGPQTAA
jgi:hypothetical protein